jgi:hypothetical protein
MMHGSQWRPVATSGKPCNIVTRVNSCNIFTRVPIHATVSQDNPNGVPTAHVCGDVRRLHLFYHPPTVVGGVYLKTKWAEWQAWKTAVREWSQNTC